MFRSRKEGSETMKISANILATTALTLLAVVIATLATGAVQGCHPARPLANDAPLPPALQIGLSARHLQHTS